VAVLCPADTPDELHDQTRLSTARVGWPRGISPLGSHRTERDSLPSLRSSHPLQLNWLSHAQCLNRPGSRSMSPVHHALRRLNERNLLYFFRAHRTR
jgi:hypothetical protein